ncbi:MAG: hydrolase [Peptococcaceae bacterium BICA1-7]|nr:MAG: hydrolase [Peptococcaceae bacterium BICA1-7]HBV99470.1 MBL fold metallo-hydrolase [Desulfotomaculum sp.]
MKTACSIKALEISVNIMGKPGKIYPALIWDYNTAILVDTGYPGQLPQLLEAIEKSGVPLERINSIIITHHDLDHTGSLADILKELPQRAAVLAHQEEKPYVQAEKPPTKMTQAEALLDSMPEEGGREMKMYYEYIRANYKKLSCKVDRTLTDEEELPLCGGITVIHTPGHTPGHISLYHKETKTLISGDALMVEDGQLVPAPPFTNLNQDLAAKSLKKLARYHIEAIACYHGGLYSDAANRRIAELASS